MSNMNVIVDGRDNNKNKVPKQKKLLSFKRVVIYGTILCAVVAGITAYVYVNKPSTPPPKSNDTANQPTPAQIKKAQTELVVEGVVVKVSNASVTVRVSGTGEQLTVLIEPSTTFTTGWDYKPTTIKGLAADDLVQVIYDKSTMRAVQIAYGLA